MPLSRTARALSATAFTTLVLGTAATAATANSGAEVSPRTVAPGGGVTVSVTCESTGGPPPETIDATSQAFEHGTVRLHRAAGKEGPVGKEDPAGADDLTGEEGGDPAGIDGSAGVDGPVGVDDPAGVDDLGGHDDLGGDDDPAGKEKPQGGHVYSGTARIAPTANVQDGGPDSVGRTSEWRVDGVCPGAHGGEGKAWSASFTVSVDSSRGTEGRHGVHAGDGGAFNDSTTALVSGGVLIAGAFGAAVHKLRHRESASNR